MKELTIHEMEQVNGGPIWFVAAVGLQLAARYTASAGLRYAYGSIGLGIFTYATARQFGKIKGE